MMQNGPHSLQEAHWKVSNLPESALEHSYRLEDDEKWDGESLDLNASGSQLGTQRISRSSSSDENRDEVKEIQQLAAKETAWIRRWRVLATLVLLGTACAVTSTTYRFLESEQKTNFEQAVSPKQTSFNYFVARENSIFLAPQRSITNILLQSGLRRLPSKKASEQACTVLQSKSRLMRKLPM